jgi:hypothetical protein
MITYQYATYLKFNSHGHLCFVNKDFLTVSDISKHSLSSTTANRPVVHSTSLRILLVLKLRIVVHSNEEKVKMLLIYGECGKIRS